MRAGNPLKYRAGLSLALAALLAACTAEARAQGGQPGLKELEAAADKLAAAEQVDAYRSLRDRLMRDSEGAEDAAREHMQERVERKLALAVRRRATPEPDATERRAMAREAAQIGMLYLKEGAPEGAVSYEKVIESIESPSPATGLLRIETRSWFMERLRAHLESQAWADARKLLERWEGQLESDPSVAEGMRTYAGRRSENILAELGSAKAEEALKLLDEEARLTPDQPAWQKARTAVRAGLVKDIEKSALETKPEEMRRGIARFEGLFPEDERLSTLMANYDELVEKTLPSPITREYGMVKNVALRVSVLGLMGTGEAETSLGDIVSEESGTHVAFDVEYHRLSRNERGRIPESGRWLGGRLAGTMVSVSDDDGEDSADITVLRPEFLLGKRGRQWNAVLGVGVVLNDYTYDGAAYKLDGTALSYASISLGMERGLGKYFSAYADAHYAGVSEVQSFSATAGVRYYPSPNFSINLGYRLMSCEVDPEDSADPDIEFDLKATLIGIALQF